MSNLPIAASDADTQIWEQKPKKKKENHLQLNQNAAEVPFY
jgi:hypothetical protein